MFNKKPPVGQPQQNTPVGPPQGFGPPQGQPPQQQTQAVSQDSRVSYEYQTPFGGHPLSPDQCEIPQAPAPGYLPTQGGNNPFARIGTADVSERSVYPIPGIYPMLYVDCLKMVRNRAGIWVFIADFDIIQSEVVERPAGTKMSWAASFQYDGAAGDVRGFLAHLMGVAIEEVDEAGSAQACSPENPCHGRLIRCEAQHPKEGKKFIRCNWRTIDENIQAEAENWRDSVFAVPF